MITLNRDRGLESVKDWNEILSLPGFTEKLNPKEHELKEIIGNYLFKDKVACGLSSCRTAHTKGYIVTTKTGQITNIGNVCGKNHFGVDFQEQSNAFKRKVTEHNNRETISQFQFHIEEYSEKLKALREGNHGADIINKSTKGLLSPSNCPAILIEEVRKIIRARDNSIIIPRIASKEEIQALEVSQNKSLPRPYYIDEVKGYLKGIDIYYPENDLRELIVIDLQQNLTILNEMNVDTAIYKDLQYWSKWSGDFENKISKIEKIIEYGVALLQTENLLQLVQCIEDKEEIKSFKQWVKLNNQS